MEATLNIEQYKRLLLAEEKRLVDGIERADSTAREIDEESAGDAADRSVSGEQKEEQFQEADVEWATLRQVRDALQRIKDGTYGKCIVDGGPIDEKRLNAMPWTSYCMKHQQSLERAHPPQTPTL
jgi:DnaK suppressor protein